MTVSTIEITQPALPKGGGAIRGIGETFQPQEFTGTAALSIPIPTSPCRGFEPSLSVDYSSGAGNGSFGLGWALSIPNIARKTSKGTPRYDGSDTFILSNAEDLVVVDGGRRSEKVDTVDYDVLAYRPRIEGLFAKIERWVAKANGDSHWRVVSKDNVTSIYGASCETRIYDPQHPSRVFQWLLQETFDAKGNRVVYEYRKEIAQDVPGDLCEKNRVHGANRYLARIRYGNDPAPQAVARDRQAEAESKDSGSPETTWHFEVVFDYGEHAVDPDAESPYEPLDGASRPPSRLDPFSTYHAGFEIRTRWLCRNILMFHHFPELGPEPVLTHATRFHYRESPGLTLLESVESVGYRHENGGYTTRKLPPLAFDYTRFDPSRGPFEPFLTEDRHLLPGVETPRYQLVDLFGEGLPGVLYGDGSTILYWEPQAPSGSNGVAGMPAVSYSPAAQPSTFPIHRDVGTADQRLMDLSGDGYLELVVASNGGASYYQVKSDRSWETLRALPAVPTDFSDPDGELVDLTGDGLVDLARIEHDRVQVYPGLGRNGFGKAESHQRRTDLPWPARTQRSKVVRFADMFGTGGNHLVQISSGRVACWPHLGYGKFADPVLFDNAPQLPAEFDAARLFLADMDGSGTADLVYAHDDRVEIWFNQSGNAFSEEPLTLPLPALCSRGGQLSFADVLGTGTMALVYSDNRARPRHWYLDLSRGRKAHLLNGIDNHLGATSKITYASSTKFYLSDKRAGRPWLTRLPFPVQVVEKIETEDQISATRLVRTYAYRHGYYDGEEREFRGFGLVERRDAETLSATTEPTDVPPVVTRTWYHTGAPIDRSVSRRYRSEYYVGDEKAAELEDCVLDPALKAAGGETLRHAHRALHGHILREEVYRQGADGAVGPAPYTVTESSFAVRLIQEPARGRDPILFVHPSETMSYHYERQAADPRVEHEFTLKVDGYGHVLESCHVTYPRRNVPGAYSEQQQLKALAKIDRVINVDPAKDATVDFYLLGVPSEEKAFELAGLSRDRGDFISASHMASQLAEALKDVRPFEQALTGDALQARLLSWQRHTYWDQGLTKKPLGPGKVAAHGLHHHSEVAVFSPKQLASVLGEQRVAQVDLKKGDEPGKQTGGGYCLKDGYWWNPGLTHHYQGESSFYLPAKTVDPFGGATTVAYDDYRLVPHTVTDALGNRTHAEFDYHTLQPWRITDINDVKSEAIYDPLGMVLATSIYKEGGGEPQGDTPLSGYAVRQGASAEEILARPEDFLQQASSYFFYDVSAWQDRLEPAHSISLLRETHVHDLQADKATKIQVHIACSDGFGRALQTKVKAGPGRAFLRDEQGVLRRDADGKLVEGAVDERWLTSGRTVYNNKGKPVKQYEPFFSATAGYEAEHELTEYGVSHVTHYDPLLRVVRVDRPDGFFARVEFTPWHEAHWDENDTVRESVFYSAEKPGVDKAVLDALGKAEEHANTPEIHTLDAQGRVFRVGRQLQGGQELVTLHKLDILGHALSTTDPREIESFQHAYDMTGAVLWTKGADAGERWALHNAMGKPIHVWDSRNFHISTSYDELQRPLQTHVEGDDDNGLVLDQVVEKMVYGEGQVDDKAHNLRGKLVRHHDQAGLVHFAGYDIMGNLLKSTRRLRTDYENEADWHKADEEALLEAERFDTTWEHDALGRVIRERHPDGSTIQRTYHPEGTPNEIEVTFADGRTERVVEGTRHNPRGQRTAIRYGNGVASTFEYDPQTFRLESLKSVRTGAGKPGCLSALAPSQLLRRIAGQNGRASTLQDIAYTYDPVGNITQIRDASHQAVFARQQKVEPISDYTYDALYRLTTATGREHPALGGNEHPSADNRAFKQSQFLHLNNRQQLRQYGEVYTYDAGGNLTRLEHQASRSSASWTQRFTVSADANRAVAEELAANPAEVEPFFDAHGNLKTLGNVRELCWDYRDNIASAILIQRDEGPDDVEYYVYDSAGQRVRKVTETLKGQGIVEIAETIYLDGIELKRVRQKAGDALQPNSERWSLHVGDGDERVAIAHHWTQGRKKGTHQVRYQLGNHLGSAALELNAKAEIISYEEYYPYGGTALIAGKDKTEVKRKTYRYSGKERDDSTGLYYYGARYYAPWLGRWLSPDPAGTVDGLNLYIFVGGNPITYRDYTGRQKIGIGQSFSFVWKAWRFHMGLKKDTEKKPELIAQVVERVSTERKHIEERLIPMALEHPERAKTEAEMRFKYYKSEVEKLAKHHVKRGRGLAVAADPILGELQEPTQTLVESLLKHPAVQEKVVKSIMEGIKEEIPEFQDPSAPSLTDSLSLRHPLEKELSEFISELLVTVEDTLRENLKAIGNGNDGGAEEPTLREDVERLSSKFRWPISYFAKKKIKKKLTEVFPELETDLKEPEQTTEQSQQAALAAIRSLVLG